MLQFSLDIKECKIADACKDPNAKCVESFGGGHTCPCKDGYKSVGGVCKGKNFVTRL